MEGLGKWSLRTAEGTGLQIKAQSQIPILNLIAMGYLKKGQGQNIKMWQKERRTDWKSGP